ncbi:MAG: hypothetical protein C0617_10980 [Desulfuromonas sp.]|uniref:hypothetical protein n=1 Tax=Desulfuromonas sp. TaxID=892 RepID=UPI000CC10D69|nr:hypothetical protein [Desulfuromonas sp.]PLX83651.1 MAG: hypothetical protein C0617_10980 [Desulfuromonas sp.]
MKKLFVLAMIALFGLTFAGITTATAEECGTGSPGYWKNHPEAWGVMNITVGGVTYTVNEAIDIMKLPVKGDKSLTLFPAVVAAMLNVQNNCPPPPSPPDCPPLTETQCWPNGECRPIEQANLWLAAYGVGTDVRANSEMWQFSHGENIYLCLDAYNNGFLPGIPSRDSFE